MKTKFSPIVKLRYSKVQECEIELQEALSRLESAKSKLKSSLQDMENLPKLSSGSVQDFLASRMLFDSQIKIIEKNRQWIDYEERECEQIRLKLQQYMIEYEKYKYLESQEINIIKKKMQIQEAKQLDEVAIMTYKKGNI